MVRGSILPRMSHEFNTTYLSIRITPKLATDLKKVASQEANTASAVVRRILTKSISRELRRDDEREVK